MKVKYFLRGIGIGILVTTLILFAGTRKYAEGKLTDEQIIKRAKTLGMMTKEEVSDYKMDQSLDNAKESMKGQESPEPLKDTSNKEDSKKTEAKDTKNKEKKKTKTKKKDRQTVEITIKSGMSSQAVARYLYQTNVIGSMEDFGNYMSEHGLTQKLIAGKYEIPLDASYEEIVEIIT